MCAREEVSELPDALRVRPVEEVLLADRQLRLWPWLGEHHAPAEDCVPERAGAGASREAAGHPDNRDRIAMALHRGHRQPT